MAAAPRARFYLRSFGCQMNDHDSERIHGMLLERGMQRCQTPEEADVVVFNTCSIREKADTRLAGHLGSVATLKKQRPDLLVVVAGCLPQSRREDLLNDYPFVDVLVGPQSLHRLPALLQERVERGTVASAFQERTTRWSADLPRARRQDPVAWVQITAGCTNFCSYCIVPYVRGPEASRRADEVLQEIETLAASGVREVTLLGQNVNAYGKEDGFNGRERFVDLLLASGAVPGIERVRFMTSHPKDVSLELIDAMARCNEVCEHVHLPVQSGSDRILSAMRRQYTREDYVSLVKRWRGKVPGVAITTDLIVGFPGESDRDFEETLALVEECDFDSAFTFVYSPRRGTSAAALPGRVEGTVAAQRMERLVATVQSIGRQRNEELIGSTVEVLVERCGKGGPDEVMGRTRTHKVVHFSSRALPGELVRVKVRSATSTSLRGEQV